MEVTGFGGYWGEIILEIDCNHQITFDSVAVSDSVTATFILESPTDTDALVEVNGEIVALAVDDGSGAYDLIILKENYVPSPSVLMMVDLLSDANFSANVRGGLLSCLACIGVAGGGAITCTAVCFTGGVFTGGALCWGCILTYIGSLSAVSGHCLACEAWINSFFIPPPPPPPPPPVDPDECTGLLDQGQCHSCCQQPGIPDYYDCYAECMDLPMDGPCAQLYNWDDCWDCCGCDYGCAWTECQDCFITCYHVSPSPPPTDPEDCIGLEGHPGQCWDCCALAPDFHQCYDDCEDSKTGEGGQAECWDLCINDPDSFLDCYWECVENYQNQTIPIEP